MQPVQNNTVQPIYNNVAQPIQYSNSLPIIIDNDNSNDFVPTAVKRSSSAKATIRRSNRLSSQSSKQEESSPAQTLKPLQSLQPAQIPEAHSTSQLGQSPQLLQIQHPQPQMQHFQQQMQQLQPQMQHLQSQPQAQQLQQANHVDQPIYTSSAPQTHEEPLKSM